MPETLIKVDLTKSAYENDMIHNRWHPDVPIVAWVGPGGRSARRRPEEGEPVGVQRLLLQEERRRLPDRAFSAGAKIDLGHQGALHLVASCSRREFCGPGSSRPDRLSARSKTAGEVER